MSKPIMIKATEAELWQALLEDLNSLATGDCSHWDDDCFISLQDVGIQLYEKYQEREQSSVD